MERGFPWRDRALLTRLLCFLPGGDVHRLAQSHRACLESILPILRQYKRRSARLALAIWCLRHLQVEFQSYYQVLDTQRIPRSQSRDPRVPPRVVSFWSERGKVEDGIVTLAPSSLPLVHRDGVTAHFKAGANEKPMLTSVVQTQRRIYTIVTVKLRRSDATSSGSTNADDQVADSTVLRQYSYVKEFGEWVAPSPAEKRMFDLHGHAPCRYDLLTRDGSMALELDVPSGADSLVDYYLVKKAVANIHMAELLQHYFQSIRPPRPLPAPAQPAECVISVRHVDCGACVHFRTLLGEQKHAYTIPGQLSIERQQNEATSSSSSSPLPSATAIEHFDVISCKARNDAGKFKIELPKDPGYVWLRIWDSSSKQIYYQSVILHQGASVIRGVASMHTQWLPGVLEYFPTLDSRQRRCLKGQLTLSSSKFSGELQELTIAAQHIDASRLERYAAAMHSYTRIEA